MSLFDTGIRPAIDDYLAAEQAKVRDYGDYWSASSAGYCMRKMVFERLGVPPVQKDGDERKTRVFESGHIFHSWVQAITKNAGLSIAQELELQDDELMVRGHIDDLVLVEREYVISGMPNAITTPKDKHLILYDYKTQHSGAFTWQKDRPISYYHRLQVGTYMYMLRKTDIKAGGKHELTEARVLKISKDDLRLAENQVLWDAQLELDVLNYWTTLNEWWEIRKIPPCTCADHEGGFLAKEKYNPFFYEDEPCSLKYYLNWKELNVGK